MRTPTHVYFIKPITMDGPIKIGCSQAPETRLSSLETWSPFALEIIGQIAGDYQLERRFHARFFHLHERREWFRASPEIYETVAAINAGTFDIATLPEGRRIDNLGKTRTAATRRQLSISLRVSHLESRSGFKCPVRTSNIIHDNDSTAIAAVEAYLSDPVKHGEPCKYGAERREKYLASLRAA